MTFKQKTAIALFVTNALLGAGIVQVLVGHGAAAVVLLAGVVVAQSFERWLRGKRDLADYVWIVRRMSQDERRELGEELVRIDRAYWREGDDEARRPPGELH